MCTSFWEMFWVLNSFLANPNWNVTSSKSISFAYTFLLYNYYFTIKFYAYAHIIIRNMLLLNVCWSIVFLERKVRYCLVHTFTQSKILVQRAPSAKHKNTLHTLLHTLIKDLQRFGNAPACVSTSTAQYLLQYNYKYKEPDKTWGWSNAITRK